VSGTSPLDELKCREEKGEGSRLKRSRCREAIQKRKQSVRKEGGEVTVWGYGGKGSNLKNNTERGLISSFTGNRVIAKETVRRLRLEKKRSVTKIWLRLTGRIVIFRCH